MEEDKEAATPAVLGRKLQKRRMKRYDKDWESHIAAHATTPDPSGESQKDNIKPIKIIFLGEDASGKTTYVGSRLFVCGFFRFLIFFLETNIESSNTSFLLRARSGRYPEEYGWCTKIFYFFFKKEWRLTLITSSPPCLRHLQQGSQIQRRARGASRGLGLKERRNL